MNIKTTILSIIIAFGATIIQAQSSFEYYYDAAGNRLQRSIIVYDPAKTTEEQIKDQKEQFDLELFPNPTAGKITVRVNEEYMEMENKKVILFSMSGQQLGEFMVNDNELSIPMEEYPAGTYILKLLANDFATEWKIIKL